METFYYCTVYSEPNSYNLGVVRKIIRLQYKNQMQLVQQKLKIIFYLKKYRKLDKFTIFYCGTQDTFTNYEKKDIWCFLLFKIKQKIPKIG